MMTTEALSIFLLSIKFDCFRKASAMFMFYLLCCGKLLPILTPIVIKSDISACLMNVKVTCSVLQTKIVNKTVKVNMMMQA